MLSWRSLALTTPAVKLYFWLYGTPMAQAISPTRTVSLSASSSTGKIGGVDLDDRDVRFLVGANEPGREQAAVLEPHLDLRRPRDDVVVREDVAARLDHETRPLAGRSRVVVRGGGRIGVPTRPAVEKVGEHVVALAVGGGFLGHVDDHHARRDALEHVDVGVVELRGDAFGGRGRHDRFRAWGRDDGRHLVRGLGKLLRPDRDRRRRAPARGQTGRRENIFSWQKAAGGRRRAGWLDRGDARAVENPATPGAFDNPVHALTVLRIGVTPA